MRETTGVSSAEIQGSDADDASRVTEAKPEDITREMLLNLNQGDVLVVGDEVYRFLTNAGSQETFLAFKMKFDEQGFPIQGEGETVSLKYDDVVKLKRAGKVKIFSKEEWQERMEALKEKNADQKDGREVSEEELSEIESDEVNNEDDRWPGFDKTDYNKPQKDVYPARELKPRQYLHVVGSDNKHFIIKNTKQGLFITSYEGGSYQWRSIVNADNLILNPGQEVIIRTDLGKDISITPGEIFVNGKMRLGPENKKGKAGSDFSELGDEVHDEYGQIIRNPVGKRFQLGNKVYQVMSEGKMTGKFWVAEVRNVGGNEWLEPKQKLIDIPEEAAWLDLGGSNRDEAEEELPGKWELYAALDNMNSGERIIFKDGRVWVAKAKTTTDNGEELDLGLVFEDQDGGQHLQREVSEAITRGEVIRIESSSTDNESSLVTESPNTQEGAQPVELEYTQMNANELNEALANLEVGHVVVYADGTVLTIEKIDQISETDPTTGNEIPVDQLTLINNSGTTIKKDSPQLLEEILGEKVVYIGKKLETEGATPEDDLLEVPNNIESLDDDSVQSGSHESQEISPELKKLIDETREKIGEVQESYNLATRLAGEGDDYFRTTDGMRDLTKLGIEFGHDRPISKIRADLDIELNNLKEKLVSLKNNLDLLKRLASGEEIEPASKTTQTKEEDLYRPLGEITSAYVDDLLRRYQDDPTNRNVHRDIEALGIDIATEQAQEGGVEETLKLLRDYLKKVESGKEAASSAIDNSNLSEGKKGFLHRLKDKLKGKEGKDKKGRWKKVLGLVAAFGVGVAGGYGAGELWGQAGMVGAGVTGVAVGGGAAASEKLSNWLRGMALMVQGEHDDIGEAHLWRRILYPIFDKPSSWLLTLSESSIKKYIIALGGGLVGGALLHWGTDYFRGHGDAGVDQNKPPQDSDLSPKPKPNPDKGGGDTSPGGGGQRQWGNEPRRGGLDHRPDVTNSNKPPAEDLSRLTPNEPTIRTTTIEPHLWGKIYETWKGAPDTGKDLTQMLNEALGYHVNWNVLPRNAQFAQISPEQIPDLLAGKIQLPDGIKGVVFTPDSYKKMHSLVDQFRGGLPSNAPEVAKQAWYTIRTGFLDSQGGVNGTKLANELGPEKTRAALEWFAQQLAK